MSGLGPKAKSEYELEDKDQALSQKRKKQRLSKRNSREAQNEHDRVLQDQIEHLTRLIAEVKLQKFCLNGENEALILELMVCRETLATGLPKLFLDQEAIQDDATHRGTSHDEEAQLPLPTSEEHSLDDSFNVDKYFAI